MIYICGLFEMPALVRELQPGYVVSLLQPELQPERPSGIPRERHHRVEVHDVSLPAPGAIVPSRRHVEELVDFLDGRDRDRPLLVHCYAGVSRSTAAALIALAIDAEGTETEVALQLREAAPHAKPNSLLVALADDVLGRNGRLVAALDAMGPPDFLSEPGLVEIETPG